MLRKLIIASLSLFLIFLLASGAYVYTLIEQLSQATTIDGGSQTSDPSDPDDNPLTPNDPDQNYAIGEIENILVLGLDRRSDGEATRSDTIMIATVDNKNDSLKLTSLMRDIYVSIPGHRDNKLNTAYAFGGVELAMETVNENFDLNIERYVVLDFSAFEEIVDAVGGISIELTRAEAKAINRNLDDRSMIDGSNPSQHYIHDAGIHTLNGRQALAFARIRDIGNDDFDRVERQQIVLSKLFDQVKTLNPLRFPSLLSAILPYVETNFTTFEILSLGTTVLGFRDKQVHRFRLPVNGAFSPQTVRGGALALVLDFDENNRLFHEFLNSDPVE
jgi:LCP family protein required for cell wall assembly